MLIDLSDNQLTLLKEVVGEYLEGCYHGMFEYQRMAMDAEDDYIKKEYSALAQTEEARFNDVKSLSEYIEKYEELMKGRS